MPACILCKQQTLQALIDFGRQPVCNRFLASPDAAQKLYPLQIGYCESCGLIQLLSPLPAEALIPPHAWITYNEPEGHLDRLAATLANLDGVTPDSVVLGISYKDDSLLARLQKKGFQAASRLAPRRDLGISSPLAGVESVQAGLNPETAEAFIRSQGQADLIVCRHILEHAVDPARFTAALRILLKPSGYLALEVPACEKLLDRKDYCGIWEEHVSYFTRETFQASVVLGGFVPESVTTVPYLLEDVHVCIARPAAARTAETGPPAWIAAERIRALDFARRFPDIRDSIQSRLRAYHDKGEAVALFGAGHHACSFINLLGLAKQVRFTADDNSRKQNLFMPGFGVPIRPSQALTAKGIKHCFLSLNPELHSKITASHTDFTDAGGVFHSIFSSA